MRVLRSLPLAQLVRASGVAVMNGDAANPQLFETQAPDTDVRFSTVPLTRDYSVEDAIEAARTKTPLPFADLWDLLAHVPEMPRNKHVIAFGSAAEVGGIMSYPYVSTCGRQPTLHLKRVDIAIGAECEVLVVEQVSAR